MKKFIILFLVLLFPSLLYIFLTKGKHSIKTLPVFGPKEVVHINKNGEDIYDTLYHTIPKFEFTDQNNKIISSDSTENKIILANFFFSTCQGICVPLNKEMHRLYKEFEKDTNIVLYSFTVDPETDSVETLYEYAQQFNLHDDRWHFLTGKKKEIYTLAQKSFFLTAMEDTVLPNFIHDDRIVLVDHQRRIRGYYVGTNESEVDTLIDEIKVLRYQELISKK